eukprot:6211487-Pleurochrysis_carterae.AAC.4
MRADLSLSRLSARHRSAPENPYREVQEAVERQKMVSCSDVRPQKLGAGEGQKNGIGDEQERI